MNTTTQPARRIVGEWSDSNTGDYRATLEGDVLSYGPVDEDPFTVLLHATDAPDDAQEWLDEWLLTPTFGECVDDRIVYIDGEWFKWEWDERPEREPEPRRTLRREPETVDPIVRRARGDGQWNLITADGTDLGVVYRDTATAPNGRRYRVQGYVLPDGTRQPCYGLATAIFVLAFRRLSPNDVPVDQQEWLAYIEGARLERVQADA